MGKDNDKKIDAKVQLLSLTIPALVTITVALIGLIGTIATLLFNFPPIQKLFDEPTSTPTAMVESITPSYTPEEIRVSATPSTIPSHPETPTATFTPISSLPVGMQVKLAANVTSGKAPLVVKLNARESFFRDATGAIFPCGACDYTWQIRQGSEIIYGPEKGDGTFEFTFGAKGTYFVSVFVCRSHSVNDCGGSGSIIEVR